MHFNRIPQYVLVCALMLVVLISIAWAADTKATTNASTELQAAPRYDLQSVTGGLVAPQTNAEDGTAVSYLTPIAVIKSPSSNEIVKGDSVEVKVGVQEPSGQPRTYHVIVNNNAPLILEDETKPLVLKDLNQGGNLLRVLIVNRQGKLGPMPQSFAMTYFYFKKRDFSNLVKKDQPFLTVNLPLNGNIVPDEQNRVCFDFIVHNAEVGGDGLRVKYTLNQRDELLDKAVPIYWSDLAPGRYNLVAELVDAKGVPVLGTYCKVERTFEISRIMKPLNIEHEDSILRDFINQSLTNSMATNPPANYSTTNSPAPASPAQPAPKKDTVKSRITR